MSLLVYISSITFTFWNFFFSMFYYSEFLLPISIICHTKVYLVKFVEGNGKVCLKCGVSFFFMHFNVIFQCRMYLIGIMWMYFNSNNFGSWSRENTVLLESRYLCINIEIFNVTYGIDVAAYLDNGCLILRNFPRSSQYIFLGSDCALIDSHCSSCLGFTSQNHICSVLCVQGIWRCLYCFAGEGNI